ncbi:MAG TPA: hypothetical protein DEB39_10400 [Planctomycetaceae bacterium]|nr:hypothetical protein [Planctomycetaceae bacterium]
MALLLKSCWDFLAAECPTATSQCTPWPARLQDYFDVFLFEKEGTKNQGGDTRSAGYWMNRSSPLSE